MIDAAATTDEAGREISVALVNRDRDLTAAVEVARGGRGGAITILRLTAR